MEAEPFSKWQGGKRRLVTEILKLLPATFGTYHEPFLGGGAVFFALRPQRAALSDANDHLMTTYRAIRDDPAGVMELLDFMRARYKKDPQKTYYEYRNFNLDSVGDQIADAGIAGWLIFLNKTGFNGLYRVNSKGGYNVPWGKRTDVPLYQRDNILACSVALKGVSAVERDFVTAAEEVAAGDAVYMDPPYAPLSATANFTTYTASGFSAADQVVVRDTALKLARRGAHVVVSNSSAPLIRDLYAGPEFEVQEVSVGRTGGTAKGRGSVKELLISARPA